ncbi:hypothetical protein AFR_42780 [Actinoplanes friuliensis DSM 7358]|uniref:Uncharacterized protein n=1 Tax=Actinoplanes friuliensis DSM 7358 TaxID=1246995 RepID=U5WFJ3_9ACTN|nr:hypothetical protein AFR_42780 [Actinoplanes friuliensis DSM 7358]
MNVGVEQGEDAVYAVDAAGGVGGRAAVVGQAEPFSRARIGQALHLAVRLSRHCLFQIQLMYGQRRPQAAAFAVRAGLVDRGWDVVAGQGRLVTGFDGAGRQGADVVVDADPVGRFDVDAFGSEFAGAYTVGLCL